MNWIALTVFLSSLAAGFLSLLALVWAGVEIYRTACYARKDAQAWLDRLEGSRGAITARLESIQASASNLSETGREIQASLEDIADTWEDLRSHPAIRAARFAGKHRRRA